MERKTAREAYLKSVQVMCRNSTPPTCAVTLDRNDMLAVLVSCTVILLLTIASSVWQ